MLSRPDSDSGAALADWLEASVLFRSDGYLAFADVLESLEAFDFNEGAEEAHARIVRRIGLRRAAIGSSYPIAIGRRGYSASKPWIESPSYSFLVLLSLGHYYGSLRFGNGQAGDPAEIFELLSAEALGRYVGGESIRFGAPRRQPVPAGFRDAIAYLATKAIVHPQDLLETGAEKDDGLDVVAWRSFRDGRPGHAVFLGQCAIGKGWRSKYGDLKYDLWMRRVSWNVTPARAFLAPIELDLDPEEWRKTLYEFGVVLDRLRLASLLDDHNLPPELTTRMLAWCRRHAADLPTLV